MTPYGVCLSLLLLCGLATAMFTEDELEAYTDISLQFNVAPSTTSPGHTARDLLQIKKAVTAEATTPSVAYPSLPTNASSHCQYTQGTWCGLYFTQMPRQRFPPKRGNKECPKNCNGVGQCDYDMGICHCPAGFGGADCTEDRKRPCWRMGPDKRDLNWTGYEEWSHSRCAGYCDDDIAMCYCPPETKYGYQPAPAGSPPGTPPIKTGRPLYWCQPSDDGRGNPVKWGAVKYEDLFGVEGWCNADIPRFHCPCRIDGVLGLFCNIPVEPYCVNQCTGHGECNQGFCKCHDGYYGHDCSRRKEGAPAEEGDEVSRKPWLNGVMNPVVAAEDPPRTPGRLRPYIYVYDLKPEFSTDILQFRIERGHCSYRSYSHGNHSEWIGYNAYAVETALHELMLASPHRTFNAEEADYFYVPTMAACLFDVYGWNPIPRWPSDVHGPRPYASAMMTSQAVKWLNETYPWFQRRGGRDHIWLNAHDEGACYAHIDTWPGIQLVHWGRMDFPHTSNTQYYPDNYNIQVTHPWHPEGWQKVTSAAHPCYDPKKDLVIPCFKQPPHYSKSQYLGGPKRKVRDILMFFRGDVGLKRGDTECKYSRCIRQTLYNLSKEHNWRENHNILYGDREDTPGDYSDQLSRSIFCLALPGDGWSARFEDAILHGCIPVIIMDDVHVPFESIMDMSKFTIRVLQKDIPMIVDIIKAVTPEQVQLMQDAVDRVWHRFRYNGLAMTLESSVKYVEQWKADNGGWVRPNEGVQYSINAVDDAFSTIIQWLYAKIPSVHAPPV